ncbi:MAG TPA: alkaline phosphatase family protein [Longimicrobiales bacterium]
MQILLVFLDGVGLGDDAAYNPFNAAKLPAMRALLDDRVPMASAVPLASTRATLVGLDATLGVDGTPQSGTGQATLLTGRNAASLHGRHFGPWVPAAIRPLLRNDSVLARAVRAGKRAAFANAYPRELIELMKADAEAEQAGTPRKRLPQFLRAGPPVAAAGAGLLTRDAADILGGNAVASEIVNDGWRERLGHLELPDITAREAGITLAAIAARHDLTLFAHYATDTVGHTQDLGQAVRALERVDEFLDGLTSAIPPETAVIVASDHGNIEDTRTDHTRNPAIGLFIGTGHARHAAHCASLLDVAPLIMALLGLRDAADS